MANRLAAAAADAVADALRKSSSTTRLGVIQRFVDAVRANNIVAINREKKDLFAIVIGGTIKDDLALLPAGFWEGLALAIGVAGQKQLFLDYMAWFANSRDFKKSATKQDTPLSDAWESLRSSQLDGMIGTTAIPPSDARDTVDDLTALANLIGPLIGDRSADKGDKAAAAEIATTQVKIAGILLVNLQPLLDEGLADLANGSDPKLLRALVPRIGDMRKIITSQDAVHIQFPIDNVGRETFIRNSFPPPRSREFKVLKFDIFALGPPDERHVGFVPTLMRRLNQIGEALSYYGRAIDPKDETSDPTLKTRQASAKGLRKPTGLNDHDGLIRLMMMVFLEAHDPLKAKPADAIAAGWAGVLDFLKHYLGAFTAHPGHDLNDSGPDYLATLFPLTIAGELLHDCAVYALRAAYWLRATAALLKTRNSIDLGMTTRLVILPNHVALAAAIDPPAMKTAGQTLPAGGLLLLNNSHGEFTNQKDLITKFNDWLSLKPAADKDPTGQAALDLKFIEDLAASTFLGGLDMPVMSIELLAPGASVTPSAVWKAYFSFITSGDKALIFDKDIYAQSSAFSQFYLNYLAVTLDRAKFVNQTMIGVFWRKDGPKIFDQAVGKEAWAGPNFRKTMKAYVDLMDPLTQGYIKKIQDFAAADQKTLDDLNANFAKNRSKIVSKFARATFHERIPDPTHLLLVLSEELRLVRAHLTDCQNFLTARGGGTTMPMPPPPPFMRFDRSEQPL